MLNFTGRRSRTPEVTSRVDDRSAIFFHDAEQERLAIAARDERQTSLTRRIVTEIVPAPAFYAAEDYHQRYFEKHGGAACATTVR